MDNSSLGSSVHGIFQARILKWVATSISRLENISGEMVLFRVGGGEFGRAARKGYRSWLRTDQLRDVSQEAIAGYC